MKNEKDFNILFLNVLRILATIVTITITCLFIAYIFDYSFFTFKLI